MASIEIGSILHERYEILEQIGRGGFGAVYKAKDTALNRICAVKENLNDSDAASRQFHREASLLAGLNHTSLPRVTDHFRIEKQGQYLVMDFIEGKSLQQMLAERDGPLDSEPLTKWMIQVARALDYLHKRNPPIIHRDIKPANIIVTNNGRAVLVDFGISKVVEGGGQTTMGARAITPGFSPPEQYGVSSTDNRSDVYALGATMYACLTGSNPPESIQMMMGSAELAAPDKVNGAISQPVSNVIQQSMALSMNSRYQTAADMQNALREAITQPLPQSQPVLKQPEKTTQLPKSMVSAPAVPVPEPPAATPAPPVSKPASTPKNQDSQLLKNAKQLPAWAWIIIGLGSFILLCLGSLLVIGLLVPDDEATIQTSADQQEEAAAGSEASSGPIEADGFIVDWRIGGDGHAFENDDSYTHQIYAMAVKPGGEEVYAVTSSELIIIDTVIGAKVDWADYKTFSSVQDMIFGPDGNLYLFESVTSENFIRVFSPDIRLVTEFGTRGEGAEFTITPGSPSTLVFGPDGLLWLLDYNRNDILPNDRLIKLDPQTGEVAAIIDLEFNFSGSDKLVEGENGRVFVLLASESEIVEVDQNFEPIREITVPETSFVDALAVAPDGSFYAGTSDDTVIIHLDENGNLLNRFGPRHPESNEPYPAGVFRGIEKMIATDNDLYIHDESGSFGYV
ncbi:MAG: serine/threonine-protein kinase, partial [Chloroflexota bacterium]